VPVPAPQPSFNMGGRKEDDSDDASDTQSDDSVEMDTEVAELRKFTKDNIRKLDELIVSLNA